MKLQRNLSHKSHSPSHAHSTSFESGAFGLHAFHAYCSHTYLSHACYSHTVPHTAHNSSSSHPNNRESPSSSWPPAQQASRASQTSRIPSRGPARTGLSLKSIAATDALWWTQTDRLCGDWSDGADTVSCWTIRDRPRKPDPNDRKCCTSIPEEEKSSIVCLRVLGRSVETRRGLFAVGSLPGSYW